MLHFAVVVRPLLKGMGRGWSYTCSSLSVRVQVLGAAGGLCFNERSHGDERVHCKRAPTLRSCRAEMHYFVNDAIEIEIMAPLSVVKKLPQCNARRVATNGSAACHLLLETRVSGAFLFMSDPEV